jgi:DNA-binding beta-propeller fold protein YncE
VLDSNTNRILRYQLNAAGYDGAPSDYASTSGTSAISGGIDIAIDGDVYVLQADGKILKYHQGSPVAFAQKGLDVPLKSPTCIFVTGSMDEGGSVYVADAGNGRIVKFSKAGDFVRQYRSVDAAYMDNLRGLFVDEGNKRVYLVNGNRLLQASLAGQ